VSVGERAVERLKRGKVDDPLALKVGIHLRFDVCDLFGNPPEDVLWRIVEVRRWTHFDGQPFFVDYTAKSDKRRIVLRCEGNKLAAFTLDSPAIKWTKHTPTIIARLMESVGEFEWNARSYARFGKNVRCLASVNDESNPFSVWTFQREHTDAGYADLEYLHFHLSGTYHHSGAYDDVVGGNGHIFVLRGEPVDARDVIIYG
jgi:hypothetical protein